MVAGASSVHAESLAQRCSDTSYPTQLVVNAGNMAAIMAEHHIAIGAAGTTAWERCALGLPSLNVELAANQEAISNWLAGSGAAINLGPAAQLTGTVLCAAVLGIVQDPKRYQQMVTTAFALLGGLDGDEDSRFPDVVDGPFPMETGMPHGPTGGTPAEDAVEHALPASPESRRRKALSDRASTPAPARAIPADRPGVSRTLSDDDLME